MNFKKISAIALTGLLSTAFLAPVYANMIKLSANQAMNVTFRIAQKNPGSQPVLSSVQSIPVNKESTIQIDLAGYELVGIVPVSINGHALPPSVTQFAQRGQCSLATDKSKTSGELKLTLSAHNISCESRGGIFG